MQTLEAYYEHNQNKELFPILFKRLIDCGFEKTLEKIAEVDINFDPINFDEELFQEKYIETYGIKTLLKLQNRIDINLLESGLRNESVKNKITYFANESIFDKISKSHIYNDNFSIEFFEKIKKIFNRFELSCFIKMITTIKDYEIDEIKEILNNPELLFKFRFLLTRIKDFYFRLLDEDFYSNEFTIFIKTLIKNQISTEDNPNAIFNLFKKYHFLFKDNIVIYSKTIKAFLEDKNRDNYDIKDLNDLEHFFEIRLRYYKDDNELFLSVFKISKEELLSKIKMFIEKNKTLKFISLEEIKLLNDLDYLKENPNFFDYIQSKYNEACKKEIASSLYIPKSSSRIIDLSETCFRAIAHKIRFASGKAIGKNLVNDLSLWHSNYIDSSYISGTLIDQYSLGMIDSTEYTLCFTRVIPKYILDMGLVDIFATIYLYYNNLPNKNSNFFTIDDFNKSTNAFYNEITLRRFDEKALEPDFVLGFDHINTFMQDASSYFQIPIGFIDSNKSATRMNNHNMILLERKMFKDLAIFIYKFYASYRYNYDIIKKYFSNSNDILNKIISDYLVSKDENTRVSLEYLIDVFERINDDLYQNGLLMCQVDVEDFRKKLKK